MTGGKTGGGGGGAAAAGGAGTPGATGAPGANKICSYTIGSKMNPGSPVSTKFLSLGDNFCKNFLLLITASLLSFFSSPNSSITLMFLCLFFTTLFNFNKRCFNFCFKVTFCTFSTFCKIALHLNQLL